MAYRKLSLEEQIDLLKKSKVHYKMYGVGMCNSIYKSLQSYGIKINSTEYIHRYIPTFTLSHIRKITNGTDLYPTTNETNKFSHRVFWWSRLCYRSTIVRINVFDLLIKELEDKLTK